MPSVKKVNNDGSPHQHVYVRRNKNSYKCMDPECSHWMPRKELKDKASICTICFKEQIILDLNVQLKLARPRCMNCANTKEANVRREHIARVSEHLGLGQQS